MDNLEFIASDYFIKNIVKALEKMAQTVIKWENANIMTYNIVKINGSCDFF